MTGAGEMSDQPLGQRLRALRRIRGLSLRELGTLSGVDHAYISRLEQGQKHAPSEAVLLKLLQALKAPRQARTALLYPVRAWR
jgi:transcriptional regulator with XRE-family HTH domain